jgi:hypothetical protein
MSPHALPAALLAAGLALALPGAAQAQTMPNLAGNYRCVPQPTKCTWPGPKATITQSGATVEFKNDKSEFGAGKITSPITISAGPPFNAEGHVLKDRSIEWSNGTRWVRQ